MANKVILYYTNIIYIRRDDGQCHPYVSNRPEMRFPNYEKHSIKKKNTIIIACVQKRWSVMSKWAASQRLTCSSYFDQL